MAVKYIVILLFILLSIGFLVSLLTKKNSFLNYMNFTLSLVACALSLYSVLDQKWNENKHQAYLYQGFTDESRKNLDILKTMINSSQPIHNNYQLQLNTRMLNAYLKDGEPKVSYVYLLNTLLSDINKFNQLSLALERSKYTFDIEKMVPYMIQQRVLANTIYHEYTSYNLDYYFDNLNTISIINDPTVPIGPACKL